MPLSTFLVWSFFLNLWIIYTIVNEFCIQSSNSSINQFWNQYYGVFNISDYKCDNIELSVLGKGLKFCPTPPKYCHGQIKESIDKFFRSCSLKLFFDSSSLEQQPEDILEDSFLSEEEQETAFDHKELTLPQCQGH